MSKPIAVLISDIHYSLPTLQLADAALRQAFAKASELEVPIIIAGDLHDTKANMRGECVNAMINTFKQNTDRTPYLLVGNHDKINEKSSEHSLNFLAPYCEIIEEPKHLYKNLWLIPYNHDPEALAARLLGIPKGSTLIMHQGVMGSNSGDYIQDKSALPKTAFENFRVISGHYHMRQDIKCGTNGLFSYIGNPYTLNFAEANDPEKGFQVLNSDGSLTFVPTNLRKHVKIDIYFDNAKHDKIVNKNDIVLVRISGSKEELSGLTKEHVQMSLDLPDKSFRLELIPNDTTVDVTAVDKNLNQSDTLDAIIENLQNTSLDQKQRLKSLWKEL